MTKHFKYCIKSENEVPATKKNDQVENLIKGSIKKLGVLKNNLSFTSKTKSFKWLQRGLKEK